MRNAATQALYWEGGARDAAGRFTEESFGNGLTTRNTFNPLTLQLETVRTGVGDLATVQM